MKILSYIITAVLIFAISISFISAQTNLTLSPSQDVTITSFGAGNNNYSQTFSCGFTKTWSPTRGGGLVIESRSIIKFDLSAIPQDAIILNAKLTLYGAGHTNTIESYLQPIVNDWSETTLTWANQPQAIDMHPVYLAPTTDLNANYEIDMLYFVDSWIKGAHNYGLLFRQGSGFISGSSYFNFASSDYPDSTMIPKLEISYTTPIKMEYVLVSGTTQSTYDLSANITGGVLPYNLAWNTGAATPNLSNIQAGIYNLSVTDAMGTVTLFQVTAKEQYPVVWTDLNNCTVDSNILKSMVSTDTSSYGAASLNQIQANIDGGIRYTAEVASGIDKIFGLSETNTNAAYSSIEYGFALNYSLTYYLPAFGPPNRLRPAIYESGVHVQSGVEVPPINAGDIYEITRTGSTINYIVNNQIVWQTTTDPNKHLIADISFRGADAQMTGIEMTAPVPGSTCTAAVTLPPAIYTCSGTQLQMVDTVYWMSFTADTTSMRIAIQTPTDTPAANIQKLILYSGDCGTLQEFARKDKSVGDLLDITKTDFIDGNTYLVKVEQTQAASGWFGACSRMIPTGGACANAINILPDTTYSPHIYNVSATEVWFYFKALYSDIIISAQTTNQQIDLVNNISAFSGSCNALQPLIQADSGTIKLTGLTINQDYYLRIAKTGSETNGIEIIISRDNGQPHHQCITTGCNLVSDGDFESINMSGCNDVNPFLSPNCGSSSNSSSCWEIFWGSPQIEHGNPINTYGGQNSGLMWAYYYQNADYPTIHFYAGEGLKTSAQMQAEKDYMLTYTIKRKGTNNTTLDYFYVKADNFANFVSNCTSYPGGGGPIPNISSSQTISTLSNFNDYQPEIIHACFTADASWDILYFYPQAGSPTNVNNPAWVVFDDVSLIRLNAPDKNITCGESTILGFDCPLPSDIIYNWQPSSLIDGDNTVAHPHTVPLTSNVNFTTTLGPECHYMQHVIVTPIQVTLSAAPSSINCGQQSTLTANVTGGAALYTYSWSDGATVTVVGPTSSPSCSIQVSPTVTTTYTVTVTENGCTAQAATIVTVTNLLTVTFSGNNPICSGGGAGICANPLNGTAPYTYQWFDLSLPSYSNPCFGTGLIVNNGTNPMTLPYWVNVTDANGCEATGSTTITVNPIPNADAGSDLSVCAGTSVTLTASGGSSYVWNNGVTQGVSFTPTLTTNYTVTVTNTYGCTNTDQVTVNVNPLPVVTITPLNQGICYGSPVTLTATGGGTYLWSNGVNTSSITETITHFSIYHVTVTNSFGCVASNQTNVFMKPLPTVQVNDISICQGTPSPLIATTIGSPVNVTNYIWSNGISGATASSISVNAGGFYTVTVTGINNCNASGNALVSLLSPPPVPQIIVPQTCLADGTSSTFSYTVPIGTIGNFDQSWNFGDGSLNSFTPIHTFASHGNNLITMTLSNQCGSTTACKPVYINPKACVCLIPFDYDIDMNVTANNPPGFFSTSKKINCTITIPNGSTVTISSPQYFGPQGRIIVESKAILKINTNIILTTVPGCDYMWQGIEVHGVSTLPSTDPLQGILSMNNLALAPVYIKNAHIGVLLGARNIYTCSSPTKPFNLAKAGGVMKAGNVFFVNNGIDVKFLQKTNRDDSQCLISGCTFQCTPPLNDNYYYSSNALHYPNTHNPWAGNANTDARTDVGILMDKVIVKALNNDPTILNNAFRNTEFGIKSFNAMYNVKDGSFTNHCVGIYVDNITTSPDYHIIDGPKFDYFPLTMAAIVKPAAIYINAGFKDHIKNCVFGNINLDQNTNIMGISLKNSTGFKIYLNTFKNYRTAINVNNSSYFSITNGGKIGPYTNANQFNTFTDCRTDVITTQDNRALMINCNHFSHATSAYSQSWNNSNYNLMNQGNMQIPMGNRFTTPSKKEIYSLYHYIYYVSQYSTSDYVPTYSMTGNQAYVSTASSAYFDPAFCILNNTALTLQQQMQTLSTLKATISALMQQYNVLMASLDKNKTIQLLQAISSNMPNGQLKNLLTANSPLSDTVLLALIKSQNPLPPGNFKNVMELNMPVTNKVYSDLFQKLNTLPPGIANQLKALQVASQGNITLASLERQLEEIVFDRNILMGEVINALVDEGNTSGIIQLLESENTVEANLLLTSMYLNSDNTSSATAKLNQVPATNQDLTDWKALYTMLIDLATQGKSLDEMDADQLQLVSNLAYKYPENLATSNAQAILTYLYGTMFSSDDEQGNSTVRYMNSEYQTDVIATENKIQEYLGDNYPNPFDESTVIPYYICKGEQSILKIYNDKGILLRTLQVNGGEGASKIDTKTWCSGVYFYTLEINGVPLAWKKMVLVK